MVRNELYLDNDAASTLSWASGDMFRVDQDDLSSIVNGGVEGQRAESSEAIHTVVGRI